MNKCLSIGLKKELLLALLHAGLNSPAYKCLFCQRLPNTSYVPEFIDAVFLSLRG